MRARHGFPEAPIVVQSRVLFAEQFLNHALFEFPNELWTVDFEDFINPDRDPRIRLRPHPVH